MHTVEISNPLEKPAEILPVFPMDRISYKHSLSSFTERKKPETRGSAYWLFLWGVF